MNKQKLAEQKAEEIIKSCITNDQFSVAKNYIDVFDNTFKDSEAYVRLWNLWKKSLN